MGEVETDIEHDDDTVSVLEDHAVKRSGGTASHVLNRNVRWLWEVSHTFLPQ
jgi:hypothetical protein